jgi:ACR3 family arsenite transporter
MTTSPATRSVARGSRKACARRAAKIAVFRVFVDTVTHGGDQFVVIDTAPTGRPAIRFSCWTHSRSVSPRSASQAQEKITPMMMKVDFGSIRNVGRRPRGLLVTLFVNWLVKPFSMAAIAWLFFRYVFSPWISPADADQYIAGSIILAAAPCTAMVFVWSYLTDGDPAYTLVQVSVNDLLMLVLFAPIVTFLVSGAASLHVPFEVLLYSVLVFIVVPLTAGVLLRQWFIRAKGRTWFESELLQRFAPVSMAALLATLVLIFAFQASNITTKTLHVALVAVPILIQVYFNSSLTYGLMRLFRVEYAIAAPGALIGASNFFELAVATAIALFGPESGAALATVVGVLIEVPVMLSVCSVCNRTRHWFPAPASAH